MRASEPRIVVKNAPGVPAQKSQPVGRRQMAKSDRRCICHVFAVFFFPRSCPLHRLYFFYFVDRRVSGFIESNSGRSEKRNIVWLGRIEKCHDRPTNVSDISLLCRTECTLRMLSIRRIKELSLVFAKATNSLPLHSTSWYRASRKREGAASPLHGPEGNRVRQRVKVNVSCTWREYREICGVFVEVGSRVRERKK